MSTERRREREDRRLLAALLGSPDSGDDDDVCTHRAGGRAGENAAQMKSPSLLTRASPLRPSSPLRPLSFFLETPFLSLSSPHLLARSIHPSPHVDTLFTVPSDVPPSDLILILIQIDGVIHESPQLLFLYSSASSLTLPRRSGRTSAPSWSLSNARSDFCASTRSAGRSSFCSGGSWRRARSSGSRATRGGPRAFTAISLQVGRSGFLCCAILPGTGTLVRIKDYRINTHWIGLHSNSILRTPKAKIIHIIYLCYKVTVLPS